MHKKIILLSGFLLSPFIASLNPAIAYSKQTAEDKIKFRQSGYMFMRWNMGRIKNQVITDPAKYNRDDVIAAANVIAAISKSGIEKLFTPETSTGKGWKETRVKQGFFTNSDKVKEYFKKLKIEAVELEKVSHTGDIHLIRAQFNILFESCKACHKDFRQK